MDPSEYRLRLHLLDLAFGALEAAAVVTPLAGFYELPRGFALALLGVGLLSGVLWAALLHRERRPIDRALRRLAQGRPLSAESAAAAHRALLGLGWRSLWLRLLVVVSCSVLFGVILTVRLGLPSEVILVLLWSAALYTPLIDAPRALLYEWLLQRLLPQLRKDQDARGRLAGAHPRRLVLAALCTGAPALLTLIAFTAFFVTLSRWQYLRIQLYFPPIPIGLLCLWGLWVRWRTRPIANYLGGLEAEAAPLYRAAQFLPYQLGLSKVALWLTAAVLLGLCGVLRWDIDGESAALLVGETVLVTLGAALYEVLWHRATLAPLLTYLAVRRHRGQPLGNPLSLRKKMLVAFGTLSLFACGLSLFWSVMQYKTVASRYLRQLGKLRLRELCTELREHPLALPSPAPAKSGGMGPGSFADLLRSHARNEVLIYYLPGPGPGPGPGIDTAIGYSARGAAPGLPEEVLLAVAQAQEGDLNIAAAGLSLSFMPLSSCHRSARGPLGGVIIVAQPGYRGGHLDTETRLLIGFFLLLLLGSMGGVVLIAADLTRPIRELERRADAIARGDLDRPILQVAVEADEVGRLYYAFEEMRRALSDRFRSSTEVNFALEAQVARRTAELERRNRELKEALEALQHVQEELLRAEKMASMGRLVAGIAHEINNPVNAVVNTAGPLSESLAELSQMVAEAPDDEVLATRLRDGAEDMHDMLRVVQRGARRTKEIVQALHNYSRGDGGAPAQVDLRRCLDDSLDLLSHYLKNGIVVEKEYGPPGGSIDLIEGYAGQLQQVFMNLLTNAAQALGERAGPEDKSGPTGFIRITIQHGEDWVVVTIADSGPGIPEDVLPRIFDPFFTTKDVGQGSGLGLSIVHSIVERHRGSIDVKTGLGQGTCFTVSLPKRPQEPGRLS